MIISLLLSKKAYSSPIWKAKGHADLDEWIAALDAEYGDGAVDRGRLVFAANCARCHSSQDGVRKRAISTRHRRPRVCARTGWGTTARRRPRGRHLRLPFIAPII